MASFPNCHACEFRERTETCYAVVRKNSRLCELAHVENLARYQTLIREKTLENPNAEVTAPINKTPILDPDFSSPPPRQRLVLARYREDTGWVNDLTMQVCLYDKSGEPRHPALPENVRFIPQPNLGREAQVVVRHIVDYYDRLAEQTFFGQAGPFEHSPDFKTRLSHDYTKTTSLTSKYRDRWPPPDIKALDLVSFVHGHEVRLGRGDIIHDKQIVPLQKIWLYGVWNRVFAVPPPAPYYFGYGACWVVMRSDILARPLGFWRWILAILEAPEGNSTRAWGVTQNNQPDADSATKFPLNAWAWEVLWYYIFQSPELYPHKWTEAEVTPPGYLQRAGNFIRAAATQAAAGFPIASEEIQEERKRICVACPSHDAARDRCNKCGCVAMTLKRSWASSFCPIEQWSAVDGV